MVDGGLLPPRGESHFLVALAHSFAQGAGEMNFAEVLGEY